MTRIALNDIALTCYNSLHFQGAKWPPSRSIPLGGHCLIFGMVCRSMSITPSSHLIHLLPADVDLHRRQSQPADAGQ